MTYDQNTPATTAPGASAKFNTLAIVGFVLAFVVNIAGVVVSFIALSQIKKTGERGRATHGVVRGKAARGELEPRFHGQLTTRLCDRGQIIPAGVAAEVEQRPPAPHPGELLQLGAIPGTRQRTIEHDHGGIGRAQLK